MHELKLKIRQALAGSSSSAPVDTKALLKLGEGDAVMAALESLLASREINTAKIIKGGSESVQCWLTGAVGLAPAFQIRPPSFGGAIVRLPESIPPIRQPETNMHKPPVNMQSTPKKVKSTASIIQPKEKPMQQASPVTLAIVEIITAQPGITRETLIELALKRAPGATEQQAIKALQNLLHASKKVRGKIDAEGERVFFLNDEKAVKAKPTKAEKPTKAKKAKVAKPAKVKPVGASSLAKPVAAKAAPTKTPDDEFSITLSESGNTLISNSLVTILLSPPQAARVHRFLDRIKIYETAAA